jgi:hypothetical protein
MKKALVFFTFFSFAVAGICGVENSNPVGAATPAALHDYSVLTGEAAYSGAINGDLGIHMQLRIEAGKVAGSYYYDSVGKDIALKGMLDGPQIRVSEYDETGKVTGTFYGALVAPGRIEGVWAVYNPESEGKFRDYWLKIYPFFIETEDLAGKGASHESRVNKEAWEGTWRRPVSALYSGGDVRVSFVTDKSFWFEMAQFAGASSGRVSGVAVINEEGAVFRDGRGGELRFIRTNGQLVLKTNDKFHYGGYGVSFDGEFTRGETRRWTLAELGILESAAQEELFKRMTGRYYDKFVDYFHLAGREDSLDGPGIKAFSGYVRGLAPYYQCIVMYSDEGAIWAALLTFVERQSAIVYFASDGNADRPIPKTIEKWIADVQAKHKRTLEIIRYH